MYAWATIGIAAGSGLSAQLSAPHNNVSATTAEVAGADKLGSTITYTIETTRNIRLIGAVITGSVVSVYKKNAAGSATFSNTEVSMANGDTLAIGIGLGSTAGSKTVDITDMVTGERLGFITLTVS